MTVTPSLQPLRVGEIIDKSIRIFRARFWTNIIIAAWLLAPYTILDALLPAAWGRILSLAQNLFVVPLIQAAIISDVRRYYLGLPAGTWQTAYKEGWRRLGSIIWAIILIGLAITAIVIGPAICLVAADGIGGLIFLIAIPVVIYLVIRWFVYIPSILIEDIGGAAGLGRSWQLTKDSFWRIAGLSTLVGVLSFMVALLPAIAIYVGGEYLNISPANLDLIATLVNPFITIITYPITTTVVTLLYFDLRVRKEAYDLELLAEQATGEHANPLDSSPA